MGDRMPEPGGLGPGAEVAGYRLEGVLGQGGMAVVHRAYDRRLDRRVALKILSPGLSGDRSFRQRFVRESRAAAAVDHPNILPVFEAGEAGGILFIAMRLVNGQEVATLISRHGPLPAARAAHMVAQMASALDAAHARGLVHRDVKPANMLRDEATGGTHVDHLYLSDFGISKLTLPPGGPGSQSVFIGTLDYCSPEQIEGGAVDGRADQYALACSAFEMLTGAPPFRQGEKLATMWAQVSADPPAVTSRRPDLPSAVDEVIARALAKAAAHRYGTCLEFSTALRRALGPAPTSPSPAFEPAPATVVRGPARGRPASVPPGPPLMPGGGITSRPLHFIVMADCSGSMTGDKMRALNSALTAMLPPLVSSQRSRAQVRLLMRVLGFATEPRWHVAEPTPAAQVAEHWRDLECVPRGRTNMAPAFRAVAEVLAPGRLERRALRPAILLITDGLPTDPPGEFEAGLAALTGAPPGRSPLRLAVAVGEAANSDALSRFRSPGTPVLVAGGIDEITDRLLAASAAVSQMPGV